VPSPDEMMAAVTTGLHDRTGHTLDEWVAMVDEEVLGVLRTAYAQNG
jgi:hypothetical protein